jgi:hypothetical protein
MANRKNKMEDLRRMSEQREDTMNDYTNPTSDMSFSNFSNRMNNVKPEPPVRPINASKNYLDPKQLNKKDVMNIAGISLALKKSSKITQRAFFKTLNDKVGEAKERKNNA